MIIIVSLGFSFCRSPVDDAHEKEQRKIDEFNHRVVTPEFAKHYLDSLRKADSISGQ